MISAKTTFKALNYFEKFRCIGKACESNCCHSWVIIVDEKIHAKYQQIDKENNTDFFRHITRKNNTSIISFDEQGYCPYLTQEKLCSIVNVYGDSHLLSACRIYPRYFRLLRHSNTVYGSCMLSCPHVMRLALLPKRKLKFLDIGQLPPHIQAHIAYGGDTDRGVEHNQILDAIHEIFCEIGRNSIFPHNKRMAALLLLCYQARGLDPLGNVEDALTLYKSGLDVKNSSLEEIPDLPSDIGQQFKIFILFITAHILAIQTGRQKETPGKKQLFTIIDQSFAGFGIESPANITDEHFNRYSHSLCTIVNPYFEANPHLWENLLSHFLLTTDFPFTRNRSPLYNLLYLGVLFLFGRGLLTGYALKKGSIDDNDFINVFHTVFRNIDHNPQSAEALNAFAAQIQANSLGQLYTILAS